MKHASSSGTLDAARVEKAGVSRRQVLARSAVAAGVVWAAPVIKTASAYALTASGTERPCTQFYIAGLTLDQNYFPAYPYGFYPPKKKNLESSSRSSSTQALSFTPTSTTRSTNGNNSQSQGHASKSNRNNSHRRGSGSDGNNGGHGDDGGENGGGGSGGDDSISPEMIIPRRIAAWTRDNPSVPLLEPDVYPQITQTGSQGWAVLLPEVTGPNAGGRQARFIVGYSYQGTHYAYGFVDPNPSNPLLKGRRLLFPSPVGSEHEGDDKSEGSPGPRRSTTTSSSSSTSTTSTTTAPDSSTTTTSRPGNGNNGNPFGPPSPTTSSSTTTTSTTTTTMPPPPPSTTTSTSTTSTSTTTSSTTTTTRPPATTTTTTRSGNSGNQRGNKNTTTTTQPPATTTTTTRPPVTTSSTTTTTTAPGSSTTTTSTTRPDGTTTTTTDDPWARWIAAGGPDTRIGGGSQLPTGSRQSPPKLKPFIDTGVGPLGPVSPLDLPEQAPARRSRRFADLFDSEIDGRPVLGAPISGVVLIYCKP